MSCVIQATALVLTLALARPVLAGPWEDAKAANDRKDYATVLGILKPMADQGNAFAQSNLGSAYYYGRGVPRDFGLAAKGFRLAADQGEVNAQTNLAALYGSGEGVPVDYVLAYMWANLGAAGGSENARKTATSPRPK